MPKISKTGKRPKQFHYQIPVKFSLLDRLILEFYAAFLNQDQSKVLRTMFRLFVKKDKSFKAKDFIAYAKKTLIAKEENETVKAELKKQLKEFEEYAA